MAVTGFPVNPTLTAVAIGYKNPDMALIADMVLPRVTGPQKFSYTKYNKADAYTVPDTKVGRKSEPNTVDFGGLLVTDQTVDYALDDLVPNMEMEAWQAMAKPPSAVDPLMKSTSLLTGLIKLDREIRVANLIFNTSNFDNNTTLSGTSQWSDYANSNPLDAIVTGLSTPIVRPNTLVFGQAVWDKVRQHPKIVQAVYGTAQTGGVVTREQAAAVFEVSRIVVGAGFYNTAKKGQTASYSRVWGKMCAALFVSEDLASADQPTFGFTAQFGDIVAGDMPDPKKGLRGSTIVRVGESVKEVLADTGAGYLWAAAVA